jgi:subtilisin-like proprotein convertase family protein
MIRLTVVSSVLLLAGVTTATADWLPRPIAVPLIGTQGPAGAYPSRQVVAARGGTGQTGQIVVRLIGVTHACPEDLAMLLVHNDTDKFLLLSNAGGCRPLQGTNIALNALGALLPDTQAPTPPYGATVTIAPSNYGPQPVFPAPAPAGPYTLGLPPGTTNINGTWDLYVFDTTNDNRGVIAGGWSLEYPDDVVVPSAQTLVPLPAAGTGPGTAGTYPITFNMTNVPIGVLVSRVIVEVTMRHTFPDDVRLVLQSPSGTAVALMANAGGDVDLAPGSVLTFADGGALLTDAGPMVAGVYSPGQVFGAGSSIPAPAPAVPHGTSFAAFNGEPVRGTWHLYAFDDASADAGEITSVRLTIDNENFPNPQLAPTPTTSTQPFTRLEITAVGSTSPQVASWRVTNGTGATYFDAGPFIQVPGTNSFFADVPLKAGTNQITYRLGNTKGQSLTTSTTLSVSEFTYSLAEGATGGFFDTDVTLVNPAAVPAPVTIDFLPEGGGPVTRADSVAANTPLALAVDSIVPSAAVSTVVHSTSAVPLAVERTMSWDSTGYGGHGGTAVGPSTRWLFAEGSQGFFDTFVLLANDNASPVDVTLRFLVEGAGVVTVPLTVPAKRRFTLFAGDVSALVDRSFGIDITSTLPIIAERAMYLPGARVFEGGHESAGVNATSREWFLAEGATGVFFENFILISNPNGSNATVNVTYLLTNGSTINKVVTVPANSRRTINVEGEDARLASVDVSVALTSDIGVVVERAMYWPSLSQGWREAHNSFGVTSLGLRWGLADCRIGGPRAYQTFVLLANPGPHPAEVQVRFLKPTFTVTRNYTLAPFSRRTVFTNSEVAELGDGPFGVEAQVLNYQAIAVEKALYWNSGAETFAAGTNVTATRLPPP